MVVDAQGRFTYVNQVAREIFGKEPESVIGTSAFEYIHPDDRQPTQEAFSGWVSQQVSSATWENRQVSATGETRHMVWTIMPRFADGQLDSIWSIAHDVTERKMAAAKLEKANDALARSNEELEQFAYVASHDLQEPLRMVASYTQLLSQRYSGHLDEKADKYIAYAVDGAQRMQVLISDLLDFSRVDTPSRPLQPTDCTQVVQEVVESLSETIGETGAKVTVGPLPTVMADRSQLHRVFQNLISNAIKFRGEEPPRVEITARRKGRKWEFCVADNGIGIAPEFHKRIFVIFQRLHERSRYPGTGIGLALVKKIVERHGGKIRVQSAAGEGARFMFTMKAAPASEKTGLD